MKKDRVQPKVFAMGGYWTITSSQFLSPDTIKMHIVNNLRELEFEKTGGLKARQLCKGVEVLGGVTEEIKREYLAPIENCADF